MVCASGSNEVTMPKFPPPSRIAQKIGVLVPAGAAW
jgi:hypothetical protein